MKVSSPWKLLIIRTHILLEKDASHVPNGPEYISFPERSPERIFIEHFSPNQKTFFPTKISPERKINSRENEWSNKISFRDPRKTLPIECLGKYLVQPEFLHSPARCVDPWTVLEKQSLIIAKQKKLIFRLHEELEKRNLKTEEVLLVLQGVTMGLKGTRNGSSFIWAFIEA